MLNKSIKAILYDLDGVLASAVEIHFDAFNMALMNVAGTEIYEEEKAIFNGIPTKKKLEKLCTMGRIKSQDCDLIWKKKQDFTKDAIIKNINIDKNKIELHEYTKFLNIRSACVTNSITETTKLILERSGQLDYIDFIISNQMVNNCKPHSEPYIKAMVMINAMPEECVIVEDSDVGYKSAINTGAYVYKVDDSFDVTKTKLQTFLNKIGALG